MSKVPLLVRIPLKYAFVASILAMAVIMVLFYTHRHPLLIPIVYDYRILLFGVFIFFTLKEFKDYHNAGVLHFWQGLLMGILFYLALGLIVGIFIHIFGSVEAAFLEEYVEGTIRGLELNREELTTESVRRNLTVRLTFYAGPGPGRWRWTILSKAVSSGSFSPFFSE